MNNIIITKRTSITLEERRLSAFFIETCWNIDDMNINILFQDLICIISNFFLQMNEGLLLMARLGEKLLADRVLQLRSVTQPEAARSVQTACSYGKVG
jgi:hypothetical protein